MSLPLAVGQLKAADMVDEELTGKNMPGKVIRERLIGLADSSHLLGNGDNLGRKRIKFSRQSPHLRIEARKKAGWITGRGESLDGIEKTAADRKHPVRIEVRQALQQFSSKPSPLCHNFTADDLEFAFRQSAVLGLQGHTETDYIVKIMVVEIGAVDDPQRRFCHSLGRIRIHAPEVGDAAGDALPHLPSGQNPWAIAPGRGSTGRTEEYLRLVPILRSDNRLGRCTFREKHPG